MREARDEVIRQEVVALGKKYFLLSRHTSLLVLENDEMYAQYGVAKGTGDTWAPYAMPQSIPVDHHAIATSAPTSDAPDDGELFAARRLLRGPAQRSSRSAAASSLRLHEPMSGLEGDQAGFDRGAGGGWAEHETTREDDPYPSGRIDRDLATGSSVTTMTLEEGRMGKRAALEQRFQLDGQFGSFGYGRGAGGGYGRGAGGGYFAYPSDPSYDDLTAFVPALVADDVDRWRRELEVGAGTHTIDAAARDLLDAARAHLATGVYRWNELEIAVDDARRIGWRRTTDTGLDETASYDGTTWTRRYAELGLDVTRAVGDDDIAVALAYLPMWIAEPAHYAKYFDVSASGRRITLCRWCTARPRSPSRSTSTIAIASPRSRTATARRSSRSRTRRSGRSWRTRTANASRSASPPQAIADAATWAHAAAASPVIVELPAHRAAYWQAKLTGETEGSAGWRRIQRQLHGRSRGDERSRRARTYVRGVARARWCRAR